MFFFPIKLLTFFFVNSTFEMYKKEIMSGNLDWTPVHKSERFWKENAHLFEEDKYKVLL